MSARPDRQSNLFRHDRYPYEPATGERDTSAAATIAAKWRLFGGSQQESSPCS
jgi:hypothetical protein